MQLSCSLHPQNRSDRNRLLSLLLVPLLAFLVLAPAFAERAIGLHPQDGPHIDLRIEIRETEVFFEAILNLAFADELVPAARESLDVLHPVEYDALESALRKRIGSLVRVRVQEQARPSAPGLFEVGEPDPSLMGLFPRYGARALTQLRLQWSHELPADFDTLAISWDAYPRDTAERLLDESAKGEVLARLLAGGVQSVITFREGEGPFRWSASGSAEDHLVPVPDFVPVPAVTFPLLSVLLGFVGLVLLGFKALGPLRVRFVGTVALFCAAALTRGMGLWTLDPGQPVPDADTARSIFEPLHRNIYRAFDYAEEGDVYDALARCVEGELLERLYTEIYASLREEEAGGAVGSVQELRWLAIEPRDIALDSADGERLTFGVDARWQVEGAVFHWGHAHWRVQELAGRYRLHETDEGWRIVDSVVEEKILVHAGEERLGADASEGELEIPEEL